LIWIPFCKLIDIIKNKIGIIINEVDEDNFNENLLGEKVGMKARDLVMLYFEIEKVFKIKISENQFESKGFDTINHIVQMLLASTFDEISANYFDEFFSVIFSSNIDCLCSSL
jgi:peptide maturation system acyl carrier-related protein